MKDAQGHGSDARGVADAAATEGHIPSVGTQLDPSQHTQVTDYDAAGALAQGGAKSAPVAAHPAMATNPRYNRDAVNNAIASSNRSGRKIGGREASLIHRLLSGGH